jgi:hypothetical protein
MKSNFARMPNVRAKRVENTVEAGTPDVYIRSTHGSCWAELKYLAAFPKKATSIVKIPHYTDNQRLWLREEGILGGNAWLFVQVDHDYFLFDWRAAQDVTGWTAFSWRQHAVRCWSGRCDWGEFVRITTG